MCGRFIGRRAPLSRFAKCYVPPPLWGGDSPQPQPWALAQITQEFGQFAVSLCGFLPDMAGFAIVAAQVCFDVGFKLFQRVNVFGRKGQVFAVFARFVLQVAGKIHATSKNPVSSSLSSLNLRVFPNKARYAR